MNEWRTLSLELSVASNRLQLIVIFGLFCAGWTWTWRRRGTEVTANANFKGLQRLDGQVDSVEVDSMRVYNRV